MAIIIEYLHGIYFFLINHPVLLTAATTALFWVFSHTFSTKPATYGYVIFKILIVIGVLTYAILIASYSTSANFIDHVEAQIASLGAALAQGQEIYHKLDGEYAYSIGYGPGIYEITSLAYTLLGNTILAAKLVPIFANILTILALFTVFNQYSTKGNGCVLTGLYLTISLVPFGAVIWLRSDPLLIMCTALSWLALLTRKDWLAHMLLGLLIGFSFLLKLHGPIYLIPTVVAFRARLRGPMIVSGLIALMTLVLMAFHCSLSEILAYWEILQINSHHGLNPWAIAVNSEFAIYFLTPLCLLWFHASRAEIIKSGHFCNFVTLVACYAIVAIIAGKPGAGNWHLLPLVPSTLVFFAQALSTMPVDNIIKKYNFILPAWVATIVFLGVTRHDGCIVLLLKNDARHEIAELSEICKKHKGTEVIMGFGDEADHAGYRATWARPWLILHGHPYRFDPVAIMDLQAANYPSEMWRTVADIKHSNRGPIVLIPHKERPFAMKNYYNGQLLTPAVQHKFPKDFILKESYMYYDVWAPSLQTY